MTRTPRTWLIVNVFAFSQTLQVYSAGPSAGMSPAALFTPRTHDPVPCALQFPGDANSSGGIALADAVFIADFLAGTGPAPVPLQNGDPDGDCCIDGADVTYVTDFIFAAGPAPVACTCLEYPTPGDADESEGIGIGDAVVLTAILYSGAPFPTPPGNGDYDGDCVIGMNDLCEVISMIFNGGLPPADCTCPAPILGPICVTGNANDAGIVDISDPVYVVAFIFLGGSPPIPFAVCSGDVDCDCTVDISDAVYLIGYIFMGGPAPCGFDVRVIACGCRVL